MLKTIDPKLQFVIDEVKRRFNVVVRPANKKKFGQEVSLFLKIYNEALQGTWGFVPLTDAECASLGASLKLLIDPLMTSIIEVDGKPVAIGLTLPDYNPLIKKINGRLFPFGFLTLLFGRKKIKKVRVMSTNVVPNTSGGDLGWSSWNACSRIAWSMDHGRRIFLGFSKATIFREDHWRELEHPDQNLSPVRSLLERYPGIVHFTSRKTNANFHICVPRSNPYRRCDPGKALL